MDGFQADTEEEEEEEDSDCMIVDIPDVGGEKGSNPPLLIQISRKGESHPGRGTFKGPAAGMAEREE